MAGPLGEERWAVVRRLYEGDELTVEEICALAGIAHCTLARRARCGGWDRRPPGGRTPIRIVAAFGDNWRRRGRADRSI